MNDDFARTVAEPLVETQRRQRADTRPKRQPRYNVILWNDDDHTYAYVVAMLMELFGHTAEQAYQMAKEVDTSDRVIVLTTTLEHAELKRDQIHAYGKDALIKDCQGAMWSTVEPVAES
ncbi:MAG: ATP-dependent Clp protease adaptor ClpS [Pirellulales bacterium]|nr:ATP-dependent Clp protease adaptor ClpS [Pirellulales bacterium]